MLLEVENLRIAFHRDGKEIVPVRDVSFSVPEHGRVASSANRVAASP